MPKMMMNKMGGMMGGEGKAAPNDMMAQCMNMMAQEQESETETTEKE